MPVAPTQLELRSLAGLFRALGDETRLRLVALLAHGELCVCHLQGALELSQPLISRHLAVLRAAGVVADRRDGSWVHYRLVEQEDSERARVLCTLTAAFEQRAAVRRDLSKVKRACGPEA
jgi:ArsR family transcriptional regulator, arsenate/arsenite/antimonite-responsive transcriptional repressor